MPTNKYMSKKAILQIQRFFFFNSCTVSKLPGVLSSIFSQFLKASMELEESCETISSGLIALSGIKAAPIISCAHLS